MLKSVVRQLIELKAVIVVNVLLNSDPSQLLRSLNLSHLVVIKLTLTRLGRLLRNITPAHDASKKLANKDPYCQVTIQLVDRARLSTHQAAVTTPLVYTSHSQNKRKLSHCDLVRHTILTSKKIMTSNNMSHDM